jgi:hypothetical protein
MLQDLRHSTRLLAQHKTWTLVVVLSLALGIGANTAIFAATNGVWFKTNADALQSGEDGSRLPGIERSSEATR